MPTEMLGFSEPAAFVTIHHQHHFQLLIQQMLWRERRTDDVPHAQRLHDPDRVRDRRERVALIRMELPGPISRQPSFPFFLFSIS